jgi:serine/tyrosine/threonine adenylyltransferase
MVLRQTGPLPGAVLTRVAASHIRVGTFEWAASAGDEAALRALFDYTVRRHYPDVADAENPALALLEAAIERQAALIAQWQLVGFIHGVMNTDNMALSGEAIDYGPCAFMDAYDPATVFSSIDQYGRYAYVNQPRIAQWNLARLAECLLPLLHAEEEAAIALATKALEHFTTRFEHHWLTGMRKKLGLFNEEPEDPALMETLLDRMRATKADYTNTFAALAEDEPVGAAMMKDAAFTRWQQTWHARLARQPQSPEESLDLRRAQSPAVIPRNHLVEAALAAAEQGDLSVMERLMDVLAAPFDHGRHPAEYRQPAPTTGACYQTFCGT